VAHRARGAFRSISGGRGRYQHGPTAVPRSALTLDWKDWPRSDDSSSIAPAYEGRVKLESRVCTCTVPPGFHVNVRGARLFPHSGRGPEQILDVRLYPSSSVTRAYVITM